MACYGDSFTFTNRNEYQKQKNNIDKLTAICEPIV
jgi:hypothetical protein